VGPAVPGAANVAPAEWVHGTEWKVPERSVEAIKMNADLKTDRPPA